MAPILMDSVLQFYVNWSKTVQDEKLLHSLITNQVFKSVLETNRFLIYKT